MTEHQHAVEYRSAEVAGVNFAQRIIEVVAAPYDQPAEVMYRGEIWQETFAPGAFDGIEKRPNRVRANRGHDENRTFGKVLKFHPSRNEGLVAEVRVAQTDLGNEVLELTNEDMLSASGAFVIHGSDQQLNRPHRRVLRSYLRHLAFVEVPAYVGAKVLAVREDGAPVDAADLAPLSTPKLDGILAFQRELAEWRERR